MSVHELEAEIGYIPENHPDEEQLRRANELRSLLLPSDELAMEHRQHLWEAAETVAGLVITPEQQEAVVVAARIMDWAFFGKPGANIPPGVLLLQDETSQKLMLDYRDPYLYSIGVLEAEFNKAGFDRVRRAISAEQGARKEQAEALIRDIIYDTAEYAFLVAFDEPPHDPEPLPLNDYWRLVRISQTEQALSHKYGVASGLIDAEPGVIPFRQELQRRMRQIDEETMPERHVPKDQQDAFARARTYFTPRVLADYAEDRNAMYTDREPINPNDWEIIYVDDCGAPGIVRKDRDPDSNFDYEELYSDAQRTAENMSAQLYTGPNELHFIATTFLAFAIEQLVDTRNGGSYKQTLDAIVSSTVDYLLENFRYAMDPSDGMHNYSNDEASVFLKQPMGNAIDSKWYDQFSPNFRSGWGDVFNDEVNLSTREEILRQEQQKIGKIRKYGPRNFRVPLRLFTLTKPTEPLPEVPGRDEDLRLELWQNGEGGLVPSIPGYKLIRYSRRTGEYGFTTDPDGDPYNDCNVVVPSGTMQNLLQQWRDIGLDHLADAVANTDGLTVAAMTRLIARYSQYYLPDRLATYDDSDNLAARSTYLHSLKEFGTLVKGGKLQVQCTGAAQFLRYSLKELFGAGCSIISGNVISGDDSSVSAVEHAQTVFVHEGKQYILDATPAGSLIGRSSSRLPKSDGVKDRKNPHVPDFQHKHEPLESDVVFVEAAEKSQSERVNELTRAHIEYLKVSLGMITDELLYEGLVRLPVHDPARVSLEILLQFANGSISGDKVISAVKYLDNCSNADAEMRKKLGFSHYAVQFLDNIAGNAKRLEYLIDEEKEQ